MKQTVALATRREAQGELSVLRRLVGGSVCSDESDDPVMGLDRIESRSSRGNTAGHCELMGA